MQVNAYHLDARAKELLKLTDGADQLNKLLMPPVEETRVIMSNAGIEVPDPSEPSDMDVAV
jgi:hypothetical protein